MAGNKVLNVYRICAELPSPVDTRSSERRARPRERPLWRPGAAGAGALVRYPLGVHATVRNMSSHAHHSGHADPGDLTRTALSATLHCLTGCAIGEVLGLVLATAFGWGNAAAIAVSGA